MISTSTGTALSASDTQTRCARPRAPCVLDDGRLALCREARPRFHDTALVIGGHVVRPEGGIEPVIDGIPQQLGALRPHVDQSARGVDDEIQAGYTVSRYHAPSDEFSEDFVFEGAVQQGALVLLMLLDIASDGTWPNCHLGQSSRPLGARYWGGANEATLREAQLRARSADQ